jgi:hypothetical protein
MFLKETKAKRNSGRVVTYLQLVESFWDQKRKTPLHKVLCNLGRLDKLDKEQIQNEDAKYDGKYVLRTTSSLSLDDIVAA